MKIYEDFASWIQTKTENGSSDELPVLTGFLSSSVKTAVKSVFIEAHWTVLRTTSPYPFTQLTLQKSSLSQGKWKHSSGDKKSILSEDRDLKSCSQASGQFHSCTKTEGVMSDTI